MFSALRAEEVVILGPESAQMGMVSRVLRDARISTRVARVGGKRVSEETKMAAWVKAEPGCTFIDCAPKDGSGHTIRPVRKDGAEWFENTLLGQTIAMVARGGTWDRLPASWGAVSGSDAPRGTFKCVDGTWGVQVGDGAWKLIPVSVVATAAADRVVDAYRGQLLGVTADQMANARCVAQAVASNTRIEKVEEQFKFALKALQHAPVAVIAGEAVADFREGFDLNGLTVWGSLPGLAEASLYADRMYLSVRQEGKDYRLTLGGCTRRHAVAFFKDWAATQGLQDIQCNESRGTASCRIVVVVPTAMKVEDAPSIAADIPDAIVQPAMAVTQTETLPMPKEVQEDVQVIRRGRPQAIAAPVEVVDTYADVESDEPEGESNFNEVLILDAAREVVREMQGWRVFESGVAGVNGSSRWIELQKEKESAVGPALKSVNGKVGMLLRNHPDLRERLELLRKIQNQRES